MSIRNPIAFIGEYVLGATAGAPLSVNSTGGLQSGLPIYSTGEITASATTTSSTPALLTSTTITPPAGTYWVWFDGTVQTTTGGNSITVYIYIGTSATGSQRTIQFPTATLIDSGYPFFIGVQGFNITVNGSQAINIYWGTSGGTATMLHRTVTAIRTS